MPIKLSLHPRAQGRELADSGWRKVDCVAWLLATGIPTGGERPGQRDVRAVTETSTPRDREISRRIAGETAAQPTELLVGVYYDAVRKLSQKAGNPMTPRASLESCCGPPPLGACT